ncbi:hypothetical protein IID62_06730 [candidate division KSB1 bacterium]|nr:hypothetical protein [candidate division KSB1 bacterium]
MPSIHDVIIRNETLIGCGSPSAVHRQILHNLDSNRREFAERICSRRVRGLFQGAAESGAFFASPRRLAGANGG